MDGCDELQPLSQVCFQLAMQYLRGGETRRCNGCSGDMLHDIELTVAAVLQRRYHP